MRSGTNRVPASPSPETHQSRSSSDSEARHTRSLIRGPPRSSASEEALDVARVVLEGAPLVGAQGLERLEHDGALGYPPGHHRAAADECDGAEDAVRCHDIAVLAENRFAVPPRVQERIEGTQKARRRQLRARRTLGEVDKSVLALFELRSDGGQAGADVAQRQASPPGEVVRVTGAVPGEVPPRELTQGAAAVLERAQRPAQPVVH